jgi:hypothetical protein
MSADDVSPWVLRRLGNSPPHPRVVSSDSQTAFGGGEGGIGQPTGAPKTGSLYPFGTTQINDVVAALGGPATMTEGQVTVDVLSGAGHVGAVLTLVDNGSNDPTTLFLVRR